MVSMFLRISDGGGYIRVFFFGARLLHFSSYYFILASRIELSLEEPGGGQEEERAREPGAGQEDSSWLLFVHALE